MPLVVAFDESGNTGDNLLDEAQSVYSLASVAVAEADAQALANEISAPDGQELKYSALRRTAQGREMVLALLSSGVLTPDTARITPMHKPFAVTARFFDYLMESTLHEAGLEVYESWFHIAFANILYRQGPAACGANRWGTLLRTFVTACRAPNAGHFDAYVRAHHECREASNIQHVTRLLDLVPLSHEGLRGRIGLDQGYGIGARDLLDPAVTSLIEQCMHWPERVGPIIVRHDDASVVARWHAKLAILASPAAQAEVGEYWAQRMPLPLGIDSIELVRSNDYRQVQLADVLAGASVTWLGQFLGQPEPREFIAGLGATVLPHLIENEVWPLPLVEGRRF